MKEKTLKFMSRYLLFGVLTCMIGFGAASCGDDYDDGPLKADMKTKIDKLTSDLAAAQSQIGTAGTSSSEAKAIATAAKEGLAKVEETVKSFTPSGVSAEDVAAIMGKVNALDKALGTNASGLTALTTAIQDIQALMDGLNVTKSSDWVKVIIGYNERITALQTQADVVKAYVGNFPAGASLQADINKVVNGLQVQINALTPGGEGAMTPAKVAEIVNGMVDKALAESGLTMDQIIAKIKETNPGLVTLDGVYGMLTAISVVPSPGFETTALNFNNTLGKLTHDYGFGYSFVKDAVLPLAAEASILVRVSPVGASLTKEMVSLMNSKGGIHNLITVKSVELYTEYLTRAASPSGLYKVTFNLATRYTNDSFKQLSLVKPADGYNTGNYILYAMSASANSRMVATEFSFTTGVTPSTSVYSVQGKEDRLNFTVAAKNVSEIRNGYVLNNTTEKVWSNETADNNTDITKNTTFASDKDARFGGTALRIQLNEKIEVKTVNPAYAYYYLDVDCYALAANQTKWKSAITGLGKIYRSNEKAEFIVSDASLKGTQVTLRMYGLNGDGTLADPDGRSFTMMCDAAAVSGNVLEFVTSIPTHMADAAPASGDWAQSASTVELAVTYPEGINTEDIATFALKMDDSVPAELKNVKMKTGITNSPATSVDQPTGMTGDWKVSNEGKIALTGINLQKMKDDGTVYNGKLSLLNSDGVSILSYDIHLKKVLPTAVPKGLKLNKYYMSFPTHLPVRTDAEKNAIEIFPTLERAFLDGKILGVKYEFTPTIKSALFGQHTTHVTVNSSYTNDESAHLSIALRGDANVVRDGDIVRGTGAYTEKGYLADVVFDYGKIKENGGSHSATWSQQVTVRVASFLEAYQIGMMPSAARTATINWKALVTGIENLTDGTTNGITGNFSHADSPGFSSFRTYLPTIGKDMTITFSYKGYQWTPDSSTPTTLTLVKNADGTPKTETRTFSANLNSIDASGVMTFDIPTATTDILNRIAADIKGVSGGATPVAPALVIVAVGPPAVAATPVTMSISTLTDAVGGQCKISSTMKWDGTAANTFGAALSTFFAIPTNVTTQLPQ